MLADRVTSIERETDRLVDRAAVLVETLAALAQWYAALVAGDTARVLARWRTLSPSAEGAPVEWTDAARLMKGVTAGIDPAGGLRIQTKGGESHVIRSGEVTWL